MKRVARLVATLAVAACPAFAGDLPAPISDADYRPLDEEEARLGQLLFYDPILSGNRNISCATCHHPKFATSDGVSLGLGEGGVGLGPERRVDSANAPEQRIPRNAPALFNLGAREFTVMFHDGRIEEDRSRPSGLRTPLEDEMVQGFASVLAAQTMFPVLSSDEMAGHYQENDIAKAVRSGRITGTGGAWERIAGRVAAIPAYAEGFARVNPEIASGRAIAFTDIANAIAAFIAFEWRADNSPFDAMLRGEGALDPAAAEGMRLFYGPAGCADCHAGPFQTDQSFHAMGEPQFGPGKAERFETHSRDVGRARVTNNNADAYAFRTPSLRNVTATGPWGHVGAHSDLAAFLRFHSAPAAALAGYDRRQAVFPAFEPAKGDWTILDSAYEVQAIADAARAESARHAARTPPGEAEIAAIIAFLGALTDQGAIDGRLGVPETVPSGLPVDR